jgi:predicted Zn-dependent protease
MTQFNLNVMKRNDWSFQLKQRSFQLKQANNKFDYNYDDHNKSALHELEITLQKLISTPLGRRAFLASVPVLLSACATPARTRYREGDNTGQQTKLTVDDERRMTAEVLPQMQKDYPPLPDAATQSYISDLGRRIASANGLEGNPYNYNFTVVGVPYVNAFALPAGTVFVTAPLIEMADTEAELAGVIGHEIGHIQARHTAERMDRAEKEKPKSWLYAIGGGLLGAGAGFGLGKLLCPKQDRACLAKASGLGAAAGAAGGFLISKYAFMANSREDEMEADRIGFRTAVRAGYHKDYVGQFYSKLLQMEQSSQRNQTPVIASIADAMSTHPPSQERVAQMEQMKGETAQNPAAARVSTSAFEQTRARMRQWVQSQKR